jgi:glycogen phosphorylase/synthase
MNENLSTREKQHIPDFLFEISWEVCNKVGGIYTVISTKYQALADEIGGDNIMMIGPDVWKETSEHQYFEEDPQLFADWRNHAQSQGLYFRVGRWKIPGHPLAVLVDFSSFFPQKDVIFTRFWEDYGLDSISGHWDYIEPAIFGYAAARVIESYYRLHLGGSDHVVAQFHEWMTGSGVLYINKHTPAVATAFTTHATVLGRSIAGNGLPLYDRITELLPDNLAQQFRVRSKHSLEKLAAENADVFTTVSQITAAECKHLLGLEPYKVTPNGFNPEWVPSPESLKQEREKGREVILKVASLMFEADFDDQTLMVLTSGRYEYRNKGIDLFIQGVSMLQNNPESIRKTLAVIAVPGYHHGPRPDLMQKITGQKIPLNGSHHALTHVLNQPASDPVLRMIDQCHLRNQSDQDVFIVFIPTYLNGDDGVFNLEYYQFLAAFDLTVFPSYYEPWGYTPLESIAFGIPTATTTLAGFGSWVKETLGYKGDAVEVIHRDDKNDQSIAEHIRDMISRFLTMDGEGYAIVSAMATEIASMANWRGFITNYLSAYDHALLKASKRTGNDPFIINRTPKPVVTIQKQTPSWRKVLVTAAYPENLERLRNLAFNLWWCWHHEATELFKSVNPDLWAESGHNPVCLLSLLDSDELKRLASDAPFLDRVDKVWQAFEDYMQQPKRDNDPLVAYFSMEYGLHESLKIYSGGLGVLAGDYLKEASDSNKRMIGIGLLFRYGYFTQHLTPAGEQEAAYIPQKFSDLPIHPVRDSNGEWITVSIALPGRNLYAKVWEVRVGRVSLYLLDADLERNIAPDRTITHQLYGGDWENRLKQEILLGVGGIRLLEKLKYSPDVYHCNEGHAAFINFERIRDLVHREFLTFEEALEVVRSSSLFTTHTPVPAGHDRFPEDLLRIYIGHYPDRLHVSWEDLMALGKENPGQAHELFSMSVLGIKTSQEVNGVSKLHGEVSRKMFSGMYEGYFSNELHIDHVTNGVHYPTWTHPAWQTIHGRFLGFPALEKQHMAEFWDGIKEVSDNEIWDTRNLLKQELMDHLKHRLRREMTRRQDSPAHIVQVLESLEQPMLTIGFARRFATYKRAHLLFSNPQRLKKLLNDKKRPIRFLFAGKAHPNDKAGQDLIQKIIGMSHQFEFAGKILFIENYDMELGRYLTRGCDIWMNTPTRPMEASGTSGEKAIMNGVLNLSVLDGWWAEGYVPDAGWALIQEKTYQEQDKQDMLDAETIYNLLEEKIKPVFYNRIENDIPKRWIEYIRNNFSLISPHFTMRRMVEDYYRKFYYKLAQRNMLIRADHYRNARVYAAWKRKILVQWEHIRVEEALLHDSTTRPLNLGDVFSAEIIIHAPGLNSNDIKIELIVGQKVNDIVERIFFKEELDAVQEDSERIRFKCNVPMKGAGVFDFAFRLTPAHPLMTYGMDFPLVKWV